MSTSDLPDEPVRKAFSKAAIDNADRLIADARLLLEHGSAPSAHSLAVLGLEEVGKAIACTVLDLEDGQSLTRAKFLNELRNHPAKLERLINFVDLLDGLVRFVQNNGAVLSMSESKETYAARLKQVARNNHARKLRGFYVDLTDDDTVETPDDVSQAEAQETIALAASTAEACRTLFIDERALQHNYQPDET